MLTASRTARTGLAIGVASLLAGCVQPAYMMPGPIPLQSYPPVSYQSVPDYRPPVTGPIPLQSAPPVQPLPPPTPMPSVTEIPADDIGGAIPVQDMPPPAADASTPAADPATAPPPAQVVRKTPTTGPGANVPLEGFRPMHSQTRPTP